MLTARTDDADQIQGLDLGADDYVCKPVRPRVLLARIQALLRRSEPVEPTPQKPRRLQFGPLVVDDALREAWLQGNGIELTSAEFDLLWLLVSNAGASCPGRKSSPPCAASVMTARTVPSTCASRAYGPRSAMTRTIHG